MDSFWDHLVSCFGDLEARAGEGRPTRSARAPNAGQPPRA